MDKSAGDNFFYRFRSTNALLDGFHELENQEIYFASPQELNDPLEGFKNLFWKGDEILWRNLLNHYLVCLMHTVFLAHLTGPDQDSDKDRSFVFSNAESLPTPPMRELYGRICEIFFGYKDIAQIPALLSTRNSLIRRNELTSYLRAFHLCAVDSVLTAMEEHHLMPPRKGDDPLRIASGSTSQCKDLVKVLSNLELEQPDRPDIADDIANTLELTWREMNLVNQCKGLTLRGGPAWQTIVCEFPRRYVSQLEQLLYPDWYTACFVESPMHAAMWGTYGDGHKGVCLKLKAYDNKEGKPAIKLSRVDGSHGSEDVSVPSYEDAEHAFCEVKYEVRFVDLDFFRSLGRLTKPMLNHWWKDATGDISRYVSDILSEPADWRKQYWDSFTGTMTTKHRDWAYEREYRLTIDDSFYSFTEPSTRRLKYHFEDLQGLIFGMETAITDQVKIWRIIRAKCEQTGRKDFEFYQAQYSSSAGKLAIAKLGMLEFNMT